MKDTDKNSGQRRQTERTGTDPRAPKIRPERTGSAPARETRSRAVDLKAPKARPERTGGVPSAAPAKRTGADPKAPKTRPDGTRPAAVRGPRERDEGFRRTADRPGNRTTADRRSPARGGTGSFAPRGEFTRRSFADRVPGRPAQGGGARNDAARRVALNVLTDVTHGGAYASLALSERLRASSLTDRDRRLVSELVYGTLERRITLDYVLDRFLPDPAGLDLRVRDILRIGAYQILYLDRVPDYSAVDESVRLCRLADCEGYAGLVNAVLRSVSREKDGIPWPPAEDYARYLSVRESLPLWIAERLIRSYGEETAAEIASWRPDERLITIRRTPDRSTPEEFEEWMTHRGWTWERGNLPDAYRVSGIGDVGIEQGYLHGLYTPQSESSMLAALAVAPRRGESILDACAAPGGKTAYLSALLQGTGRVYAWDVHPHRVELIRRTVERLRLDNVRPAVRDATVPKPDLEGTLDAVLLDAPCTGFGVMFSKPDVRYRQSEASAAELTEIQHRLLDVCCRYVRPGGRLVYSTCTILPEENALQIERFLREHPEFEPDGEALRKLLPGDAAEAVGNGYVQLLAHRQKSDGFFIARMRRRSL